MASSSSAQQPAEQQRPAEESREEFHTRMRIMVSRLDMTDTIFFHKLVTKSMATELLQGPLAYALEFPRAFLKQHCKKLGIDVTFGTQDSPQTWPIQTTIRVLDRRARVFAYGLGGWKAFLMDNHIKVGDILIFKLTRFSHFEVVIGRSPAQVDSDGDEDDEDEDEDDADEDEDEAPLWPSFFVTINRPSQPRHPENHFYLEDDLSLVVPSHFWELNSSMLEGNQLEGNQVELKGPTNTITMVRVVKTVNEGVEVVRLAHSGWKAFLLANNLTIGDVLKFSLVANSSFTVEVVVE